MIPHYTNYGHYYVKVLVLLDKNSRSSQRDLASVILKLIDYSKLHVFSFLKVNDILVFSY